VVPSVTLTGTIPKTLDRAPGAVVSSMNSAEHIESSTRRERNRQPLRHRSVSRDGAPKSAEARVAQAVSHELRNGLTSISAAAELFLVLPARPGASTKLLGVLRRGVDRLVVLAEDLDALAVTEDIRHGRYVPVWQRLHPGDLLERVVAGLEEETSIRDITIDAVIPVSCPHVMAEARLLKQAIANLLRTAVGSSPPGSKIVAEIRPQCRTVTFLVRDNGPTIPATAWQALFDLKGSDDATLPRWFEGRVLSLTVARLIAETYRGTVECSTASGGGMEFRLAIPAASDDGAPG